MSYFEAQWNKTRQDVPHDKAGNILSYAQWYNEGPYWALNETFTDTLTFKDWFKGRSGLHIRMIRTNGLTVPVFMRDFEQMIPLMVNGKVKGTFTVYKRGANYGVGFVEKT